MLLLATTTIFAQETKKELEKEKTKIDAFASKTGSIIKLTDYKLSGIKTEDEGLYLAQHEHWLHLMKDAITSEKELAATEGENA